MSDHPNVSLARAAWEAISRGDVEALLGALTSDVVWHATARGTPWYGTHRGAESVVDYLARVGEASEFFEATLVDVLASDERVLLVFHASFRRKGRVAELDYLLLARVREGKVAEMWTTPLDPGTIEAFWTRSRESALTARSE
jgi:ketosteroid isomerase-like protein